MRILYCGEEIGRMVTNKYMDILEAIEIYFGYNLLDYRDRITAYNAGLEFMYMDDNGLICVDIYNLELEY